MSYVRKIKFEYLRTVFKKTEDPDDAPDRLFDLRRWIDKADRLSLEGRTYDYYNEQARLDKIMFVDQTYKFWYLQFVRLRDTNLPSKATANTETEPIFLEEDEFFGEEVSALYDESLNVMMLQRNRFSLSPTGIEQYLNLLWGSTDETIYLRHINWDDSIARAKTARYYRKLTVRFADLSKEFKGNSPIKDVIRSLSHYDAFTGEISVSLGYNQGKTLQRETILDTIGDILNNRDIINKAELSKKEDDDTKVEVVDLFDDKIHDYEYISLERKQSLSHEILIPIMINKYLDRRGEIASKIPIEGNERNG